ncbi:MAG: hypothetical protein RDU20_12535 [Desulfomonilaceae bacterium]|nr:hypothetical protein [Desulfomonilaceae bacterium]
MTNSGKIVPGIFRIAGSLLWFLVLVLWLSASSCVVNRTTTVSPSEPPSEASAPKKPANELGDVKRERIGEEAAPAKTTPETSKPPPKKKHMDEADLDRMLRTAADELASQLGRIEAMKLCHVEKENEWWVVFYQDIGPVIDVRNYIWNWEEQRFRPYLVVKRFPKNELQDKVNRLEHGRKCVVLKSPKGASTDKRKKRTRQRNDSQEKR